MIFVAYWNPDGTSYTLTTPENIEKSPFLLEDCNEWLYTIHADSYIDAMEIHHAIQGLGTYKPMDP